MPRSIGGLFGICTAATLAVALASPSANGQSHTLRVSTVISDSDPLFEGYRRFADAVEHAHEW